MEFESIEKVLSLSGSAIALATTLYFWLVRANNERPNLSMVLLKKIQGTIVLPQEDIFPYHQLHCKEDHNWIRYQLEFALINNSTLPNAALGFSADLLGPDGQWIPAHCHPLDQKLTPVSLSPSATTRIEMALYVPTGEKGGNRIERAKIAADRIHKDQQIRLVVYALKEHQFEFIQSAGETNLSVYQQPQAKMAA